MWKDIKGYEGRYQVSDEGQIRRVLTSGKTKILKPYEGSKYNTLCLSKDQVKKTVHVHRIVAETFLEKPEGMCEVNHKDGNKRNNRLENLEWVTQRENLDHAITVLNHYPFGKPARKVRCLDKETGRVVQEFNSMAEASRVIGKASARTSITLVCQGLQSSAYGYKWEYID